MGPCSRELFLFYWWRAQNFSLMVLIGQLQKIYLYPECHSITPFLAKPHFSSFWALDLSKSSGSSHTTAWMPSCFEISSANKLVHYLEVFYLYFCVYQCFAYMDVKAPCAVEPVEARRGCRISLELELLVVAMWMPGTKPGFSARIRCS